MTTLPTTRPSIPVAPRSAPAPAAGPTLPQLDPVRLLKKYKWVLGIAAAAGLVFGIAAHYLLLFTYPIYKSYITYECLPIKSNPADMGPMAGSEKDFEKFMATQVKVMTSEKIIDMTVSDPTLLSEAPKWTGQFMQGGGLNTLRASKALKRNLSAAVQGDSRFVQVSFWWTDSTEAAAVLRTVGRTYEAERNRSGKGEVRVQKETIELAIKNAEEAIKKLQTDKETLLRENKIESLEEAHSSANKEVESVQSTLVSVRADREALVSQRDEFLNQIQSGTGPTIPDTVRKRVEENPTLIQMKHMINQLDSELTSKIMQGVKAEHPDFVKLKSLKEGADKRYEQERERLLRDAFYAEVDGLKSAVAAREAQEAKLQDRLEKANLRATELTKMRTRIEDINTEINRRNDSKAKLSDDLSRLEINTVGSNASRITLYQDAQIPKAPAFPKVYLMVPLGLFLALGLVGGVVVLLEVIDQRVKGPADVAALPRTRVLGLIPHSCEDPQACERIETVFRDRPSGVLAESFRQLRSQIIKRMSQGGHKTLVVLAPSPDAGTTAIALNLAFSIAATDQRVLLIDANFRRPALHKTLGLTEGAGLADVLAGATTLENAVQASGPVSVLQAGSADKRIVERLATEPMNTLLRDAAAAYDMVIIDVAPTLVSGDGLALANRCDAAIMVVRAMVDKRGMVARLRSELAETKADLLGVVVNAVRTTAGGYLKGNIESTHRYQSAAGAKD
jgi:polysaccharide biosynthesis transport protein